MVVPGQQLAQLHRGSFEDALGPVARVGERRRLTESAGMTGGGDCGSEPEMTARRGGRSPAVFAKRTHGRKTDGGENR